MNRKRGLGSGLDALLPNDTPGGVREVLVEQIHANPRQPRTLFDEVALDDLAASIREHGVIQPLIVTHRADGSYELVAGERRWRASQRAGLQRVPVLIRETTPQQLLELAIIENVQRADLNALEEAQAYQSLKDEFGLSDEQIARRVGKNTREAVANTRRLLKLPVEAQEAILQQTISAGHGRALLKLATPEQQVAALQAIATNDLSVRDVERLYDFVRDHNGDVGQAVAAMRAQRGVASNGRTASRAAAPQTKQPTKSTPSDDDRQIARDLERTIGEPVNLTRMGSEVRITITFHTEEKLQEFFDALQAARTH